MDKYKKKNKDITYKVEKFEAYLKKREYADRTVFIYKTYILFLLRYLKKNNTNFLEAEQYQISQYNINLTRAQQLMLRKAIKAYADYLHRFKGKEKKEFTLDIKKDKKMINIKQYFKQYNKEVIIYDNKGLTKDRYKIYIYDGGTYACYAMSQEPDFINGINNYVGHFNKPVKCKEDIKRRAVYFNLINAILDIIKTL